MRNSDNDYVTREFCDSQKAKFITKEVCELKDNSLKESVMDICNKLDTFENNHFVHMQSDMNTMRNELTSLKWQVAIISSAASLLITIVVPYVIKAFIGV